MKYYVLAGLSVLVAAAAYIVLQNQASLEADNSEKDNWKRFAVETETKVRPEHFEGMKFQPSDAVELRAPASQKKKSQ